jgi:predicted Zn-dependent peptidase
MLFGYIGCKGAQTRSAISETLNLMKSVREDIPEEELELKRLDALNSFVFNVDSKMELVQVYSRYYMRKEPLDTLEKIQDAFFQADRRELRKIAKQLLDPNNIQIVVVADKLTQVKTKAGHLVTLEEDLKVFAESFNIPFREIALR